MFSCENRRAWTVAAPRRRQNQAILQQRKFVEATQQPRSVTAKAILSISRPASNSARRAESTNPGEETMNIHLTLGPLIALIAGVLILLVPKLLNYIVAIYLIVIGLIGLFGYGGTLLHT
jgi:hypothetical protein